MPVTYRTPHRGRLIAAAAIAFLLVVGLVQLVQPSAAQATSSVGGSITRSEIITRAKYWVDKKVPYSQAATYPDPQGKRYRTDCSGMVSMAWHLDTTGTYLDGGYNTGQFGSWSGKTNISWSQLRSGDAVLGVGYGHIALFDTWADSAHTAIWVYQENAQGTPANHTKNSVSWYQSNGFQPIRYNKVIEDSVRGTDTYGYYNPADHTMHLKNNFDPDKQSDIAFGTGFSDGLQVLIGDWDGV